MDGAEFETSLARLNFNRELRYLPIMFGDRTVFLKETDPVELTEVMSEAYENMQTGIHENVCRWSRGEEPLLRRVVTPTAYINGVVANTKTEFLLASHNYLNEEKQPKYILNYLKARDAVYEELLQAAIHNDDFDMLLGLITTYKEPTLAKRLLGDFYARKERYPNLIAGDARVVTGRIRERNRYLQDLKKSVGLWAVAIARREQSYDLRRRLNNRNTGVLGALAVGARFKFGQPRSKRKWQTELFIAPLETLSQLPTVPEQLVAQEKSAIPLDLTE